MSLVEIELSENEKELLAKQDKRIISNFEAARLEKDARKNWDKFYMRNTTNFFKDRHWTTREFEELKACREVSTPGVEVTNYNHNFSFT